MRGVGKLVCHAREGVGAIATQSNMNPYWAYDGLRAMSGGAKAAEALREVVDADPGREFRQCGMMDMEGRSAAWTGEETPPWSGDLTGEDYAAQGNRLVGPETLRETVRAFHESEGLPLVERLLLALEAGEATGADKEGAISANIIVMDTEEYPLWDVRVDHAEDSVVELRRLYKEFAENLAPVIRGLPTRNDPLGDNVRQQRGWSV